MLQRQKRRLHCVLRFFYVFQTGKHVHHAGGDNGYDYYCEDYLDDGESSGGAGFPANAAPPAMPPEAGENIFNFRT